MGLFGKTKDEKTLDEILQRMQMNMSNNYKDNAIDNLREFEESFERMCREGALKEKVRKAYGLKLEDYRCQLKGYGHKDQKPFWT